MIDDIHLDSVDTLFIGEVTGYPIGKVNEVEAVFQGGISFGPYFMNGGCIFREDFLADSIRACVRE
jgi:hypothetical protein